MTGQHTIVIEFKDGTDETRPFASPVDAEAAWEELTDNTGGIQYAAWQVPAGNSRGYRLRGYYGTPRTELSPVKTPEELRLEEQAAMGAFLDRRERAHQLDMDRERRRFR